ncbi:hypothetical protein PVAND_017521 [Polypedilum vanderplanki]|uniref:glutathione transferase n=1 Tax=Polypedilum vanderplanki TaxID=319348 RepID=A0A9J6BIJ1_POLVA|nr:hypothetical protein PVAND_017521 [Polypedilum vanderplanki]
MTLHRPTLFYVPLSPPARAVMLTAKEIELDLEVKLVDLFALEQKSASYRKINPLGKIPALIDDDIYIWDSHAIMIYIVEKFAEDDSLYPHDLILRTKVNQMLFFEATVLFQLLSDIVVPIYHQKMKEVPQSLTNSVKDAYDVIETMLKSGQKYICGETLTIADLSIWTTLLSLRFLVPIDSNKFLKLDNWLKLMKSRPTYDMNQSGANQHYGFIRSCIEGKPVIPVPITVQK